MIAHGRGIDVLVAARRPFDGVDVNAALVGEGGLADPGLARVVADVRDLVHELGKFSKLWQRCRGHPYLVHLKGERGDDTGEVAIAGALTVAIDGALNVGRADIDRRDGVGDSETAVIVRVNAEARLQSPSCGGGDAPDLTWEATTIGVAETDDIGAGVLRCLPGGEGIILGVLVAVKRVFRVID